MDIDEFLKILNKRKAVRNYIPDKTIPEKDIQKIIEAINLAPSACNLQSFRVFIIKDKNKIKDFVNYVNRKNPEFVPSASLILVFCSDPVKALVQWEEKRAIQFSIQDATIASSFAILATASLGYGSCWVGSLDEEGVKKLLNTSFKPVSALIIGYSNEDPPRKTRKEKGDLVKFI